MIESFSRKLSTWNRSRKTGCLVSLFIILCSLICVFIISSTTTIGTWDGMYPSGEYHLKIEDELGNPIKGATLSVFDETEKSAFEYPIDNHLSPDDLISDEQGVIVALHRPRGFEFGGTCLYAFWIIPMCSGSPKYDGQISADGYQSIRFPLQELFDLAYDEKSIGTTAVVLENGETVELSVYEKIFVLKK